MQNALAELLAGWLPAQRWFAGSGANVRQVRLASDVLLADGDPELRHLIADAWVGEEGEEKVTYQVPLGIRAELPPVLDQAAIGRLPDGRMAYDGARDPALATVLLRGIAENRRTGPLRFVRKPGARIDADAPARALPAVASNTSIVFGERAILKLLRRPFTGQHPDLEVPAALARNGSTLVAAPLGWIEMPHGGQVAAVQDRAATLAPGAPPAGKSGGSGDEQAVLAILSDFFANASDGWSLATASVGESGRGFAEQAGLLGEATAQLHAEMAAAFGTSKLSRHALKDLTDAMTTELHRAIRIVPRLNEYAAAIGDCYAALAEPDTEVPVQRIHGDYHLAQVLHTRRGWIVLDFEGEPSVPLARRRAYAPALRDVAGMLRSFDYAGRHQAHMCPDDRRLQEAAQGWIRDCQRAFRRGYAEVTGTDPAASGPLLRALILQKAVYEAVYEASHRPGWLPIPLAAIAEASR